VLDFLSQYLKHQIMATNKRISLNPYTVPQNGNQWIHEAAHDKDSQFLSQLQKSPKISLAFIFSIVIMRALPQLRNSIAAFCSSFSDLSLARMQIAPV